MGGYFAAKARLFTMGGPDRAVIGVDEVEGRYLAGALAQGAQDDRVIRGVVGLEAGGLRLVGLRAQGVAGRVAQGAAGGRDRPARGEGVARRAQPPERRGLCGLPVAGLAPKLIEGALHSFAGLPHRSQLVGERAGVRFRTIPRPPTWIRRPRPCRPFRASAGSPGALGKRRDRQPEAASGVGGESLFHRPFGAGFRLSGGRDAA